MKKLMETIYKLKMAIYQANLMSISLYLNQL
jgi:hypothetical protein